METKNYYALLVHSGLDTRYLPVLRRVEIVAESQEDAQRQAQGARRLGTIMPETVHSVTEK